MSRTLQTHAKSKNLVATAEAFPPHPTGTRDHTRSRTEAWQGGGVAELGHRKAPEDAAVLDEIPVLFPLCVRPWVEGRREGGEGEGYEEIETRPPLWLLVHTCVGKKGMPGSQLNKK